MRKHLLGLRICDLEHELASLGLPEKKARYHSHQIFRWIYNHKAKCIDEMTDLSKEVRSHLRVNYVFDSLPIVFRQKSSDGTEKFLLKLSDAETIESVLIPAEDRLTICVSSQVGCAMGCKFCLTASMGLIRNLEVYEIVSQVFELSKISERKITNIVFMGMGEPLHNLENVARAIEILLTQDGMNFSKRKITVSTSGLVPAIRKFNERLVAENRVNLAISLNASHNEQRESVMPVNRAFPIEDLLDACREFELEPHRRITFEYVMMGGLNDSLEDAARVIDLLSDVPSKVNLIPFNPHPESDYKRPSDSNVEAFHKYLLDRGISAMIRHSRGRDILAACGQLRSANPTHK